MKKITVSLPEVPAQEYNIIIGKNILQEIENLTALTSYSKIAIVSDSNVKPHLETLAKNLRQKPLEIILEPGEKNKNVESLELIWSKLADAEFDRKSLVINLGGGVICDIGGLAASTYMRGIDFINLPTTLLSQVDASVGGKTGIDFAGLKNLIGLFQQPKAVIIDVDAFQTLPSREFISGFSEVIKHGLISDEKYFYLVKSKNPKDFSDDELIEIISKSCEIKKEIVEKDPTEKSLRKILNFGHTIGHAIEAVSLDSDETLLHGEAISIGMTAEAKISNLMGYISDVDLKLIEQSLENAGLPIAVNTDLSAIFKKIKGDKKNTSGQIKWTLLRKIGEAIYDKSVNEETIKKAIEYVL